MAFVKRCNLVLVVLALTACGGPTPPEHLVSAPGGPAGLVVTQTNQGAFEGADAYVEVRRSGHLVARVRGGSGPNHQANIDVPPGRYTVTAWLRPCPSTGCVNEKDHVSHAPRTPQCSQEVEAVAGSAGSVVFSTLCSGARS